MVQAAREYTCDACRAVEIPDPRPRAADACSWDGFVWQHLNAREVHLCVLIVEDGSRPFVPKCVQEAMSEACLGHVVFESVWRHFIESWVPCFGRAKDGSSVKVVERLLNP